MSHESRFQIGRPYLLTDVKERAFDREPAVYVGRNDADMGRPSICAVCGEPLGAKGYASFLLMCPDGRGKDMMVGNGCLRDRIVAEEASTEGGTVMEAWERTVAEFPDCGRWYGTFLHNCIAKPYVRDRRAAEGWGEPVLGLPGVRFIMDTVDGLRDEGWTLEAERVVDSGRIDMLATHPDKGTMVLDWKSDKDLGGHDAYVEQVKGYMADLNKAGVPDISGCILWIDRGEREPVPFDGPQVVAKRRDARGDKVESRMRCTLWIDKDAYDGKRRKRVTMETSDIRPELVTFHVPRCRPSRRFYEFSHFEAPPYKDGGAPQRFSKWDAYKGFYVSFVCSKKRHSFVMTAKWKLDPTLYGLVVFREDDGWWCGRIGFPEVEENGKDCAQLAVSSINE